MYDKRSGHTPAFCIIPHLIRSSWGRLDLVVAKVRMWDMLLIVPDKQRVRRTDLAPISEYMPVM